MLTVLDVDDPAYYGDLTLSDRRKSAILFNTNGSTDTIPVVDPPLPITGIPDANTSINSKVRATFDTLSFRFEQPQLQVSESNSLVVSVLPLANVSVDSLKRIMTDILNFNTLLPLDTTSLVEGSIPPDLTCYKSCLGFRTENIDQHYWDKMTGNLKDGGLVFKSSFYNDTIPTPVIVLPSVTIPASSGNDIKLLLWDHNCLFFKGAPAYSDIQPVASINISSTTVPLATTSRMRYFNGDMNFSALPLRSIKSYLAVTDPPDAFMVPIPDMGNLRNVPLAGRVVSGEYTFLVIDEAMTKILHKSDAPTGNFEKTVQTDNNYLLVVAVSKDNTKKSFAYKHIDVTGVGAL